MHLDFNISSAQFHQEYLYQKPMVFKGAVKNIDIGWKEINELYQRANPMDPQFKLRKGGFVPKEGVRDKKGALLKKHLPKGHFRAGAKPLCG